MHAAAEITQAKIIVPLRPHQLLKGIVSQHPMVAQDKYGAALTRPNSHVSVESCTLSMPNSRAKKMCEPLITVSYTKKWGLGGKR